MGSSMCYLSDAEYQTANYTSIISCEVSAVWCSILI